MSQPFGAVILTFNSKGQVLLGKRLHSYKSGNYGAPGGRIEVGEKIIDCAKRELKEETGINATELHYLGFVKENQGGYDFIHFVCTAKLSAGQVPQCREIDKCEAWEWFEIDQLPKKIVPGHLAGIELLKNKVHFIEI